MADRSPEKNEGDFGPDRPLECSECKKAIAVHYTEIIGDTVIHTCMCSDCPELRKRLNGISSAAATGQSDHETGLACGNCGTTLETVKVGHPLGCSICYEVFDDMLLQELMSAERLPARLANQRKSTPVHIGRAPGEAQEMTPSMRLLALNEALTETLKREDYEQAAWLRDQIKALTPSPEEEIKEKKQIETQSHDKEDTPPL